MSQRRTRAFIQTLNETSAVSKYQTKQKGKDMFAFCAEEFWERLLITSLS